MFHFAQQHLLGGGGASSLRLSDAAGTVGDPVGGGVAAQVAAGVPTVADLSLFPVSGTTKSLSGTNNSTAQISKTSFLTESSATPSSIGARLKQAGFIPTISTGTNTNPIQFRSGAKVNDNIDNVNSNTNTESGSTLNTRLQLGSSNHHPLTNFLAVTNFPSDRKLNRKYPLSLTSFSESGPTVADNPETQAIHTTLANENVAASSSLYAIESIQKVGQLAQTAAQNAERSVRELMALRRKI
jgi:hypothetical protein